jgi:release factor glutamine methyltransferase
MENRTTAATEPARQVSTVLRHAARRLISAGIASGPLDAEVLLGHVLSVSREQIVLAANTVLDDAQLRAYERLLSRRLDREPAAYITGRREFWSLDFPVTPDVLIPRPETEVLVEIAVELAIELRSCAPLRIVDLGTGSGAIAVALATELVSAEIWATDISAAVLAVAKDSAARNHVAGKIKFVEGDLFEALEMSEQFDLIISNPPYIRSADIDRLEPEVSRWEPRGALDGGLDGLEYYRRIAAQAFHYLAPSGVLTVEIGAGMGKAVAALLKNSAGCAEVNIHSDYAGKQRVVVARKIAATMNSI